MACGRSSIGGVGRTDATDGAEAGDDGPEARE
jgi:hypothetical protein